MIYDCDLCGSSEYTPVKQGAVVCVHCGFVYVRERRTSAEIAKAWDDIWGEGYTSSWPAVQARLFYVAEYLNQLIGLDGKELLDVGAGEGTFLEFADLHGAIGVGLEPDGKNCATLGEKGFPNFNGTIENFETPAKLDIITLNWTLENTGDCIGVLKKCRELLKPDGHICVATGSRILVPYKKPFSSYFSDNPPDLHCFRFSQCSLWEALSNADFGDPVFNDFVSNDWLVAVASPITRLDGTLLTIPRNDPNEVLRYFHDWESRWP